MSILFKSKDGGAESSVTGYWLCEFKSLFSVVLLRFDGASRECYHDHAFNCFNWVLRGELHETMLDGKVRHFPASARPFGIYRDDFHKVSSVPARTWVLSFRGPWSKQWHEVRKNGRRVTLESGRVEV